MYNDEIITIKDKENSKKNKKNIIIFAIIILLLIVLSFIFINMQSTDNSYIILDNFKAIQYLDNHFEYVENDDYFKSNYKVFYQNDYIGSYFIDKVDSFTGETFFTNSNSENRFLFDKPLLALSSNLEFIEYENGTFTNADFEIFYNISSKDYIVELSDITHTSKVTLDFDNDGKFETFYAVTYERTKDLDDDEEMHLFNYSLLYYVKNNYTYLIKESEPYYEGESIVFPNYRIRAVIDVNNDNVYEVIVTNMKYDNPIYEIYELKNDNYEMTFTTTIGGSYE